MQNWHDMAAKISFRNQAFIDGKWTDAASGKVFETRNPATDQVLTRIAECDLEDVNRAVTAARRAFEAGLWSKAAPEARKEVLLKLAELIRENQDELALL